MAAASLKLASPKPLAPAPLLRGRGAAQARPLPARRVPPPARVAVQPPAAPPAPRIGSFDKVLEALIGGTDFSEEDAEATLRLLLEEKNEARIAAFLVLLRAKGETYEEVCVVSLTALLSADFGTGMGWISAHARLTLLSPCFRLWGWRRRC